MTIAEKILGLPQLRVTARPANATTSRFRPIASSAKSTVTLVSFPTPVNS